MAIYTTEVRTILESLYGVTERQGFSKVEEILKATHTAIFTPSYRIFDEDYREGLEMKILRHYYNREIGFETAGLWQMKLCARMNEVMPYFNQFYISALLDFNPLYNVNIQTTHDATGNVRKGVGETITDNSKTTVNATVEQDGTNYHLFSDTPQGALTGVDSETYLTSADKTTDKATTKSTSTTDYTDKKQRDMTDNTDSVDNYLHKVEGYQNTSASKLLLEYRETFLNIDMMLIESLNDLFMGLWNPLE